MSTYVNNIDVPHITRKKTEERTGFVMYIVLQFDLCRVKNLSRNKEKPHGRTAEKYRRITERNRITEMYRIYHDEFAGNGEGEFYYNEMMEIPVVGAYEKPWR